MFERLELLIGKDNLEQIKSKKVLVVGVGGVGGFVVEGLIRSGIENITIIDNDIVSLSNKNRQVIALDSTINRKKVEVLEKRILDINPNVIVTGIDLFLDKMTISDVDFGIFDYVIDCCDFLEAKKLIIKKCLEVKTKFISCMGTGKRLDPTKLMITDIRKTSYDPIARILRKYLKDENINDKVLVCYSSEIPKKQNFKTIASAVFVPSSAGILIASYVIRDFINEI